MREPSTPRRGWSRRRQLAAAIVSVWLVAVALLARRQRSGGLDELPLAARVSPSATFFVVEQSGEQIGYASSTVDSADGGLTVTDQLVADVAVGGRRQRTTLRSRASLGATLAVRTFAFDLTSEAGPLSAAGTVDGDTLLTLLVRSGDAPADTQRVRLGGPVLLPTTVPLVMGLRGRPKSMGDRAELLVFDPLSMAARSAVLVARAESVFVLADSAVFDSSAGHWREIGRDTVRAWKYASEGGAFTWWVDRQGTVVEAEQAGGFVLRRRPYGIAFENWRIDGRSGTGGSGVTDANDIIETSAVAAAVPLSARRGELRVRLGGVRLADFDLNGGRQSLQGDTLTVRREDPARLQAFYTLPGDARHRAAFRTHLQAEPLLQVGHPDIRRRLKAIAMDDTDPVRVAERINRWLYTSLAKEITLSVPNALQTLESRSGDCNEHTQLFLALARTAGIPARAATGLAWAGGKFYYHAWPEVFLDRWVAVDPSFGQFPADAGHLRFVTGGLAEQAALLGIIGRVRIDVLTTN
jgi:transglutaminase-like putative cysteine protease